MDYYTCGYFKAKLYKVMNNVETYQGTFKIFVPFDDNFTATNVSTTNQSSVVALRQLGIDMSLTYFSIRTAPTLYDSHLTRPSVLASRFGHTIELDDYVGGSLKFVIDEHRTIVINVPLMNVREREVNIPSLEYIWYYDNMQVAAANLSGPDVVYSSLSNSRSSNVHCRSIAFPFPNGNYYSAISGNSYETYNTSTEEKINQYGAQSWKISSSLSNWLNGWTPEEYDIGNPYIDGGTSEIGGGGGNFSENSDDVDVDQMPTVDAVGTGFATLFTPSKTQLKALADVMWDSNIFTALQNLVENITGMFTSLAIVPFEVTAGNTVEVTWFGLAITEIFLTLAAQQYYEFDMGSIDMKNDGRIFTSGSALDYSPFSSLGIFLPFIGFQELDIDECRDAVINLKYRIDILSGTCVALISLNGNTVYQFTGNCLSQIPITNENMQSLVTDAVQVGIAAAATHSAKGAVGAAESAMEGAEGAKEAKAAKAALGHAEAHLAQTKAGLASATANASMGMKPVYGKAGAISASASLLAVKQPYLFLRTPRQSIPDHYQRYCGFPSNMSGKLSSFSGYTVVEDIRLNGLVATSPEVAEIYQLLKGGVII